MAISRSQLFVPKVLPAGRLPAAVRHAFELPGITAPDTFTLAQKLADGSDSRREVRADELGDICDLREGNVTITASSGAGGPSTWHYIGINGGPPGTASVHVQAPDGAAVQALIDGFMTAAELDPYIPPAEPAKATESNVEERSPASSPEFPIARLRAFLSFRFGNVDNDATASYVERLLALLDVEVITGRGYEPRPIGAKVTDRLEGLDFLVLIVGADGESAWTRDEIATVRAKGVPVVPLVANGATFEPGMFGDLEYIPFDPAHPGDLSIPLVEAVLYVRRIRGRSHGL